MKKVITVLFVAFIAYTTQAQVKFSPGLRAGLNLANFTNTDFDTKADFYVGGQLDIRLASFYTLQPELTYSRQGAKGEAYYYTGDGLLPSYSVEQDYSIQYLSLGIMNKFHIVQGFHAVVGPTIDFKVGDNFPDFDDELLPLDITLMGGLGYTFPMGLTIEARYKIGLVDIFGNNYSTYDDDNYNDSDGNYNDVILNNVIQLGLAYSF